MPTSSNPPPPGSEPAPASTPPGSTPPGAQPAQGTPATADTINQALAAVKAQFPAESSALSDLQLRDGDDATVTVTIVLNPQPKIPSDQVDAILQALVQAFHDRGISQTLCATFGRGDTEYGDDSPASTPSPESPSAPVASAIEDSAS